MQADWGTNTVIQHRIHEIRSRRERCRVLLRRYGDNFILHAVVVVACLVQLRLYVDAFQNPHSCFTHSLFARTYTGLNVFMFVHSAFDIVVLVLLHLVLAPKTAAPPAFPSLNCTCCYGSGHIQDTETVGESYAEQLERTEQLCHNQVLLLSEHERKYSSVAPGSQALSSFPRIKVNRRDRRFFCPPVGALFDIAWSCVSILSGLNDWRTHPFFFFRLMGYAIHHGRIPCSLRVLVSLNKHLFDDGNVVLDMTYITDRVIAMGLPAVGLERLYRNPMDLLATYLRIHHPSSHIVINTCAERTYNKAYFHRLCYFPCKDHEVMPLHRILVFCQLSAEFLQSHANSVLVVHCMGGKGRTGLMITSWLIYSGLCNSAMDALHYYARRRTDDVIPGKMKTLTNACQVRFLWYFETLCRLRTAAAKEGWQLKPPQRLQLKRCVFMYRKPVTRQLRNLLGESGENVVLRCVGLFPPDDVQKTSTPYNRSSASLWDYLDAASFAPDLRALVQRQATASAAEGQRLDINNSSGVSSVTAGKTQCSFANIEDDKEGDKRGNAKYQGLREKNPHVYFVDWRLPDGKTPDNSGVSAQDDTQFLYDCSPKDFVRWTASNQFSGSYDLNGSSAALSSETSVPCDNTVEEQVDQPSSIIEEFGIEVLAQSSTGNLEPLARLWLHADFLYVGLPDTDLLIRSFEGSKDKLSLPPELLNENPTKCLYKEVSQRNKKHIVVSYTSNDMDFKTKRLRKQLTDCDCFLSCLFEVVDSHK